MQASAKTAVGRASAVAEPESVSARYPENPHYRPGRVNKSNVTGYFPPEVKRQLRMLAAEKDTTIQHLLAEALNDLFAKNGKPEIAPLEEEE
jgi:hypothetical protein